MFVGLSLQSRVNAEEVFLPVGLAKAGELILEDVGAVDRGRQNAKLNHIAKVRAGAGRWQRAAEQSNIWRSTWKSGDGHIPVMSYHGFEARNLIIEVTFRFGEQYEPQQFQCFRIAADQRAQKSV